MSGSDKYKVKWSTRFKKDYKLAMKRGYNIDLLDEVIRLIAKGGQQ
jgi:mRNA interferase YafQ